MSKKPTKKPQTVILLLLQGRPRIISDDDGEPHAFASVQEALEFTTQPHLGIQSADAIYILDMGTGEMDTL